MDESNNFSSSRNRLVIKLEKKLEGPMIILGFIWLVLLIVELINGFDKTMELISTVIWIVFICDFILKLVIASEKWLFLKKNILTIVSLIIPALRLFRIFRFIRLLRVFRGTRLIKVVASVNRGMKSLNATMGRRGFGYVMALTLAVILAGAAGMFAFETGNFESYGVALWWTTMLVITVGTDFWPKSIEGRILTTLISLYGFAVFGYITATLASFFIGSDAKVRGESSINSEEVEKLRFEIRALNKTIQDFKDNRN
ncbi:potassium channel family protein [Daejeonella lutea]|uniref:Voltage-gated potassium channel n=1 Tax=Daejeonella lutea TaxID=572036 RepID=A0A1T5ANI0_9SPHI|nr:potassium channel family protein [Daejeonella lutea]SKB36564.1 voltage-gated potassium channel [Daejeonella lutea]